MRILRKMKRTFPQYILRTIYNSLIHPHLIYGLNLWGFKHKHLSKIRVAYNNVYRKILGVSRRSSASAMFVTNDIPNFEAFFRKSIYSFTTRISFSSNNLICAIKQSWVMKTIWKMWEEKMYI